MSATPSLMSLYVLDREKQEFVPSMIQVTIASGISELNDERSRAMLVSALSCKEEEYHERRWQIGASLSAFRIFNGQKKQ